MNWSYNGENLEYFIHIINIIKKKKRRSDTPGTWDTGNYIRKYNVEQHSSEYI